MQIQDYVAFTQDFGVPLGQGHDILLQEVVNPPVYPHERIHVGEDP